VAREIDQKSARAWALARRQHDVITRRQLRALGFSAEAIDHRIEKGRLREVFRGVYAVGPGRVTFERRLMAAVLACGDRAMLSHVSAGVHWGLLRAVNHQIEVTVLQQAPRRPRGIRVHRRPKLDMSCHRGIPVTTPVDTLVDIATRLADDRLERAVNEASNRDLVGPEHLRSAVGSMRYRAGARRLLEFLDRDTYVVTDSRLEQRFLRIVREAGLPLPETQVRLGGGRVDFYWADLELVVEADSLRFHRTPAQQASDTLRDQKHAAAGLFPLRFTHWQIFHDPEHVVRTLRAVMRNLRAAAPLRAT
jgi:very-short-patch-repair endonuclease